MRATPVKPILVAGISDPNQLRLKRYATFSMILPMCSTISISACAAAASASGKSR